MVDMGLDLYSCGIQGREANDYWTPKVHTNTT